MTTVKLKGNEIELYGDLPELNSEAPGFVLTNQDMSEVSLSSFAGKNVILNIFPSIDTPVCSISVSKFNNIADKLPETVVLGISNDLPFALQRYCAAEGLKNIKTLSAFRSPDFGKDYGVLITTGPLTGLLARAVVVIGKNGQVVYKELVPEIGQEPNYDAAIEVIKGKS